MQQTGIARFGDVRRGARRVTAPSSETPVNIDEYLDIYLNDHRAGAAGGAQLARRILRSNRTSQFAADLEALVEAIEADRSTLDEVRVAAGVTGGALKQAAALVAERGARLKLNGHLLTYSPLSRVLELEALMAGVQAKRRLWAALRLLAPSRAKLEKFDFEALEARASAQLETIGGIHESAVAEMAEG